MAAELEIAAAAALARCELCPRRCGVNRAAGATGDCRAGRRARVYGYGAHPGEEPPLSGARGSGVVFFSGCNLRCLYCQNWPWSQEGRGAEYGTEELAGMLRELRAEGCHNWNLVSPTPWLPLILPALDLAAAAGRRLPVVYNTSGYERVETIRALGGRVDVYLTDLRYAREASGRTGSGVDNYVAVARAALLEMQRQAGPWRVDAAGRAAGGVICRILILPGRAAEACASLEWLADRAAPGLAVSVMAQYTPAHRAAGRPPWQRRITPAEYRQVRRRLATLEFAEGWIQDYEVVTNQRLAGFNLPPRRAARKAG